ncbi:abortive infection family protein [Paraburkholderia caledonica]|uniref:Abortive infection protein-like C-terminal domain-containing protein n=1 Tax=Paraburkholderia caledonica TaxID=134536 RepID=A0ABU1L6W4_9BURK|nr:abortive infection family protein [Paraburkholderia caledonica]MDR6378913.1 hypothetical protein [Paraburkholderia caledonica]
MTLRASLLARADYAPLVPRFVRTCRDLSQFWQFIKHKFPSYAERRLFLWDEFRPLLERIEGAGTSPADSAVTAAIEKFDSEHVLAAWNVFTQILGGCQSVVEGLGALRNKLSDAHGKGKRAVKPAARHAELAVNLSGALALYLLATLEATGQTPSGQ